MRKAFIFFFLLAAVSCESIAVGGDEGSGAICVRFATDNPLHYGSKSGVTDTNRFILSVTDASGGRLYCGSYGDAPEEIAASPGSYTVSAVSEEFAEPLFDRPQYGDTRIVEVKSGQTVSVLLDCTQQNSGLKINVARAFASAYPEGILYLKSSTGTLMYGYTEKRTAYFKPGPVTLTLSDSGVSRTLFTRILESRQVLVINLSTGDSGSVKSGISVQVDTSRQWVSENYSFVDGGDGASDTDNPMSVTEARLSAGRKDVWVYGYIVGGDLTSSRCSFETPFTSRTNLVLAAKSSCRDKNSCLSVQLSAGDIREALNLVDNPGNLGRQIRLKGTIVASYYGIPGLQGVCGYEWN